MSGWPAGSRAVRCPSRSVRCPSVPSRPRMHRCVRTGSSPGRVRRSRRRCSGTPLNCIQRTNSWHAARVVWVDFSSGPTPRSNAGTSRFDVFHPSDALFVHGAVTEVATLAENGYEPAGSARLELVAGVALLHEDDAVVEAMLQGWARQQLGGRGLTAQTVARRTAVVRRFLAYTNEYPSAVDCGAPGRVVGGSGRRKVASQVDDTQLPQRDRLLRAVPSRSAVPVGRGVPGPVRHAPGQDLFRGEHAGAPGGLRGRPGPAAVDSR